MDCSTATLRTFSRLQSFTERANGVYTSPALSRQEVLETDMNLKKTLTAGVLAIGLTAGVASAYPQGEGVWRKGRHGGRIAAQLDLTEAQKQHARDLFRQGRQEAKPIADELRKNRAELAAAVKANNTAAIQQLTERQGVLRGQISAIRARRMASFYAQLTPEQRAKAEAAMEARKERSARMQQRFRERRGPLPRQ